MQKQPSEKLSTLFAAAERATDEMINQQMQVIGSDDETMRFIGTVPNLLLVLNSQRQIVYTNDKLMALIGIHSVDDVLGMRPGELLDCQHSYEMAGGCGTSETCRTCGAVMAVLSSLEGKPDIQECRITQKTTGDALDYRVFTSPITVGEGRYVLFMLTDISSEKRRRALERIFFHDVLNTAGGLRGFAEILKEMAHEDEMDIVDTIYHISETIIDEIQAQKDLMAAENKELTVHAETVNAGELVQGVANSYRQHLVAEDKTISVAPGAEINLETDATLLRRVVGNMLKNALEASSEGETVLLGWNPAGDEVEFWVHNNRVMSRDVQLQVFKRSYTTKGVGRGLGTHSMKLLSERYLQGTVRFTSQEGQGTRFIASYPRRIA